MFLNLARLLADPHQVFLIHPVQLSRWLDEAWAGARIAPPIPGSAGRAAPFLGSTQIVDALRLPDQPNPPLLSPSGIDPARPVTEWDERLGPGTFAEAQCAVIWHHLIYAYLIESTGAFEVFAEVLRRAVIGESLGELSAPSVEWVRATEELFFRDPPPFTIASVVSQVRPHSRTNRRNAYWRMFGMDLPHTVPEKWGGPAAFADWKAGLGTGVNSDFRAKWNELLRQVWLGIENSQNASGANPADASYIAMLCRAIKDMLRTRRRGGALAREEFAYVSVLSWFHLSLDNPDSPIVADLKAQASSPAERLSSLATRVGMTPAARSRELFELAEPMSRVLRAIELGLFDTDTAATAFFTTGSPVRTEMVNIINNWQSATGERVKERPTGTVTTDSAQPLRIPVPGAQTVATTAPASSNGDKR